MPKNRGKNFSVPEMIYLLEILKEFLPRRSYEWDAVVAKYNDKRPAQWAERDMDSLRRKFKGLANGVIPTGDPEYNALVHRAQVLRKRIMHRDNEAPSFNDDDDEELALLSKKVNFKLPYSSSTDSSVRVGETLDSAFSGLKRKRGMQESETEKYQKFKMKSASSWLKSELQDKFDDLFVMMLISANLPASICDNIYLQQLVSKLHPGYQLPTQEKVWNEIGPRLMGKTNNEIEEFLCKSQVLTLIHSVEESRDNQPIIYWSVVNEDQTVRNWIPMESRVFSNSVATIDLPERQQIVESFLEECRTKAALLKSEKKVNRIHLTIDHSSGAYHKVKQSLQRQLFSVNENEANPLFDLIGPCLSQQTILLCKDLIWHSGGKYESSVVDVITAIYYLRENCGSLLSDSIDSSLRIWEPSVLGFGSIGLAVKQILSVRNLLTSAPKLHDVSHASSLLHDCEFWDAVESLNESLVPFHFLYVLSETDSVSSGLFMAIWLWWSACISKSNALAPAERSEAVDKYQSRMRSYATNHHLVSWALDPRLRGIGLSPKGLRMVKVMALELAHRCCGNSLDEQAFARQWTAYFKRASPFDDENIWIPCVVATPIMFWKELQEDCPELACLAIWLFGYSPQTASISEKWTQLVRQSENNSNSLDSSHLSDSNASALPLNNENLSKASEIRFHLTRQSQKEVKSSQRSIKNVFKRFHMLVGVQESEHDFFCEPIDNVFVTSCPETSKVLDNVETKEDNSTSQKQASKARGRRVWKKQGKNELGSRSVNEVVQAEEFRTTNDKVEQLVALMQQLMHAFLEVDVLDKENEEILEGLKKSKDTKLVEKDCSDFSVDWIIDLKDDVAADNLEKVLRKIFQD